jgi:Predicted permease.
LTADEVKDISYIAAVIDTFLVMNGLGVLAALLVFAAMLMYLQTRQRSEIVSYGLSLRMGMRSSRHLAAIAIEVGAMLLIAYVAGTVLAIAAAQLTVPLLDPIEASRPIRSRSSPSSCSRSRRRRCSWPRSRADGSPNGVRARPTSGR